jgi:hypothetical protein
LSTLLNGRGGVDLEWIPGQDMTVPPSHPDRGSPRPAQRHRKMVFSSIPKRTPAGLTPRKKYKKQPKITKNPNFSA